MNDLSERKDPEPLPTDPPLDVRLYALLRNMRDFVRRHTESPDELKSLSPVGRALARYCLTQLSGWTDLTCVEIEDGPTLGAVDRPSEMNALVIPRLQEEPIGLVYVNSDGDSRSSFGRIAAGGIVNYATGAIHFALRQQESGTYAHHDYTGQHQQEPPTDPKTYYFGQPQNPFEGVEATQLPMLQITKLLEAMRNPNALLIWDGGDGSDMWVRAVIYVLLRARCPYMLQSPSWTNVSDERVGNVFPLVCGRNEQAVMELAKKIEAR